MTVVAQLPIHPLDAPGMPVPGPQLRKLAASLGDESVYVGKGRNLRLKTIGRHLEDLCRKMLYSSGNFALPLAVHGGERPVAVLSGHRWEMSFRDVRFLPGPRRAEVMVIGKMLGLAEFTKRRNLCGPSGKLLRQTCEKLGIPWQKWYVTNLVKALPPEETGNEGLRPAWVQEFLHVLHQELRLVRPQFILCLGTDALKALLGRTATLASCEGRVLEYTFPVHRSAEEEPQTHTAWVMAVPHPAAVLRKPEQSEVFETAIARFGRLISGGGKSPFDDGEVDHRLVEDIEGLRALAQEIDKDIEQNLLAVDAEWHGAHPQNPGTYLRCIQLSWKPKTAAVIALRYPGGAQRFRGDLSEAYRVIRNICRGRRIAGHFFNADLEWLLSVGIDLRSEYSVADNWEKCMEDALAGRSGGFDTALALHAVEETADFSLKSMALRFTSAPRYDVRLLEWKKSYCAEHKLREQDFDGFGECPSEILEGRPHAQRPGRVVDSYAAYDADVTRRLVLVLQEKLSGDAFGNNCWEAFWISMRANAAVLEINTTGVLVDRERIDILTDNYIEVLADYEKKIREFARWPTFNLSSTYHVREFLFGEEHNGKRDEKGAPVRLRPEGALSLKLKPAVTTDKRPLSWDEVLERGEENEKLPGTNKTALGLLLREVSHGAPQDGSSTQAVGWLRDYRFLSQVLRSVLRPPLTDREGNYILDDRGHRLYSGGLPGAICADGRVRTTIYPVKETGRWSSARPPLQNISKRREEDYARLLGEKYHAPLRSIIRAPEGHALVEADYIGAELFGMAIMSGDPTMIEHCRRNQLPEDHPDYYDIHSHIACLAFGLKCSPTKSGLKSIGKSHLRGVAKSVIFGVSYGRGAKAIALAAKEEGVDISVEDAKRVIQTIFKTYPGLVTFFDNCRTRVTRPRWICGPFGRFRRFPQTREREVLAEFERQAMNFPIQGMIADAVARGLDHLYHYRQEHPEVAYRIVLQIHDAVLLEVPGVHVARVVDEVLPECMCRRVPIYPCSLDGLPTGAGPYYLGIDTSVQIHWGQTPLPDMCETLGFDPRYARWRRTPEGWMHSDFPGKVFRRGKLRDL